MRKTAGGAQCAPSLSNRVTAAEALLTRRRPSPATVKLREYPLRALETNPGDVKTLQAGGEHAVAWWMDWMVVLLEQAAIYYRTFDCCISQI